MSREAWPRWRLGERTATVVASRRLSPPLGASASGSASLEPASNGSGSPATARRWLPHAQGQTTKAATAGERLDRGTQRHGRARDPRTADRLATMLPGSRCPCWRARRIRRAPPQRGGGPNSIGAGRPAHDRAGAGAPARGDDLLPQAQTHRARPHQELSPRSADRGGAPGREVIALGNATTSPPPTAPGPPRPLRPQPAAEKGGVRAWPREQHLSSGRGLPLRSAGRAASGRRRGRPGSRPHRPHKAGRGHEMPSSRRPSSPRLGSLHHGGRALPVGEDATGLARGAAARLRSTRRSGASGSAAARPARVPGAGSCLRERPAGRCRGVPRGAGGRSSATATGGGGGGGGYPVLITAGPT